MKWRNISRKYLCQLRNGGVSGNHGGNGRDGEKRNSVENGVIIMANEE